MEDLTVLPGNLTHQCHRTLTICGCGYHDRLKWLGAHVNVQVCIEIFDKTLNSSDNFS